MLLWVGVGFTTAAVALGARWSLHRRDALGRTVGFPIWSVSLLAVAAMGCWYPVYRHHQLEERLSVAASTLVGFPVHVHCQTWGQAFVDVTAESGWVAFGSNGVPEHKTFLKQDVCGPLRGFPNGTLGGDQVIAVHVLTHESMHMAGITDEAQAECAAMQRDSQMAQVLGASPAEGAELAWRYWQSVYPRMSDGYIAPDCVANGSLDEHLPDAPWAQAGP